MKKEKVIELAKDLLHGVLYAKATNLDYGYDDDEKQANEFLEQDKVYKIDYSDISVGQSSSRITIPYLCTKSFNSVHFKFFLDKDCKLPYDICRDKRLYNFIH